MGCGRIVTSQDIQQLREARKGLQMGSAVIALGQAGLGLQMIRNSNQLLNKVIGDIGERITEQTLKGHNLNTTVKHNSKVYDVGNKSCLASVKTYGVGHGSVSRSTVSNYVRDLRVATGRSQRSKDIQKFNAAVQELRQAARQSNVPLPFALQNSPNDKAAGNWISKNAEMRIPDDQVCSVRAAVHRSVIRNPSAYGLSANATPAERATLAKQLMQQVQPMGMSIMDIERTLEKHL